MKMPSFFVGLAVILLSTSAMAFTGDKCAHEAKISIDQTRSAALQQPPGTDQELEPDNAVPAGSV